MRAAKEKTLIYLAILIYIRVVYDLMRKQAAEKTPIGPQKKIRSIVPACDQQKTRKRIGENVVQLRRSHRALGTMYFRARFYDPNTREFISRDPLEYVDGMSLFRAYFVLGGKDPFGLQKFATEQECEDCFHNCLHEFLIRNPEIYFADPGKVGEACRQWCGKKFPVPERPIDETIDVKDYNCAGLAFREYDFKSKADTKKKLEDCKVGKKGQPCTENGFCLKCIFYDITGFTLTKGGKVIHKQKLDDFHFVCGLGDGTNSCSKNGQSPIDGPGPVDSFPPHLPYPPPKLPPGVDFNTEFTETHYCCPTK